MTQKIAILGSTGSIGTQALELVDLHPDLFEVFALSAHDNIELLLKQIKKFKPKVVAISNMESGKAALGYIPDDVQVLLGPKSLSEICSMPEVETVLISIVGMAALPAVLEAIYHGKKIALANKESLVTGGQLVRNALKQYGGAILPVDSEHSAIFQCLQGVASPNEITRLLLTASGGPFRDWTVERIEKVTLADALRHPNWSMGKKITIDSATLMNKGLEIIEARWLFNLPPEHIDVLIHPQSVIHSMVELVDGSVLAQMAVPDMKIPILYALTYPKRMNSGVQRLNFLQANQLTFEKPDYQKFPCLQLAYYALKQGGIVPTVLNAANEVAVGLFLQERIKFLDIYKIVEKMVMKTRNIEDPSIDDIYSIDQYTRNDILSNI